LIGALHIGRTLTDGHGKNKQALYVYKYTKDLFSTELQTFCKIIRAVASCLLRLTGCIRQTGSKKIFKKNYIAT